MDFGLGPPPHPHPCLSEENSWTCVLLYNHWSEPRKTPCYLFFRIKVGKWTWRRKLGAVWVVNTCAGRQMGKNPATFVPVRSRRLWPFDYLRYWYCDHCTSVLVVTLVFVILAISETITQGEPTSSILHGLVVWSPPACLSAAKCSLPELERENAKMRPWCDHSATLIPWSSLVPLLFLMIFTSPVHSRASFSMIVEQLWHFIVSRVRCHQAQRFHQPKIHTFGAFVSWLCHPKTRQCVWVLRQSIPDSFFW